MLRFGFSSVSEIESLHPDEAWVFSQAAEIHEIKSKIILTEAAGLGGLAMAKGGTKQINKRVQRWWNQISILRGINPYAPSEDAVKEQDDRVAQLTREHEERKQRKRERKRQRREERKRLANLANEKLAFMQDGERATDSPASR